MTETARFARWYVENRSVPVAELEQVVETRSAQVADVNYPKRLVTVIAMPYEEPTEVMIRGRLVNEVVTRGAFNGIERRGSQIKVNRDHDSRKPVGKIVALHPSRKEGLVAEFKVSPTPLGDESLALAEDRVLDASAGFALLRQNGGNGPVYPDAEVWERNRTMRRLNRLRLDHLALVMDPAYPSATVLDVRDAPVRPQEPFSREDSPGATPNLDRLEIDAQRALLDEINRRYGI